VTLLETRLAWQKQVRKPDRQAEFCVHLLATFTINPLEPYLGMALLNEGFAAALSVGPFDQVSQQLLQATTFASNDVVVVWPRLEDAWVAGPLPLIDGDSEAALRSFTELGLLCVQQAAALGVTVVVVLPALPDLRPLGVGDAGNLFGMGASSSTIREALRATVAGSPGVLVFDAEEVIRTIGSRSARDDRRFAAASIPYTEETFALVAERLARLIKIQRKGSAKVAVVDADNTLWGGVVGELGASGVDLADQGPGVNYREFQRFLLELGRAGMLTVLASKNNEADAFEVFDRREMLLKTSDLAAWRVDWNPKSSNIASMAEELSLGTASMVFVDDSAIELGEVSANVPGIAVVAMPEDPAQWSRVIGESGLFDRLPPTSSDLGRTAAYATESVRKLARVNTDLSSFLASLDLRLEIFCPQTAELPRLAQLVAKSNQFTLDGPRHSEAVVAQMSTDPNVAVRLVSAIDRFGDYGVIGALIVTGLSAGTSALTLDTFVLSCRAMGRGIEEAMLAWACELAQARPLTTTVVEGPKNQPLRQWIAAHLVGPDEQGNASEIAHLAWPAHITSIARAVPGAPTEQEGSP
jgi:FkbH-like protein